VRIIAVLNLTSCRPQKHKPTYTVKDIHQKREWTYLLYPRRRVHVPRRPGRSFLHFWQKLVSFWIDNVGHRNLSYKHKCKTITVYYNITHVEQQKNKKRYLQHIGETWLDSHLLRLTFI